MMVRESREGPRVEAAQRLSVAARVAAVRQFFARHRGGGDGPLGFGRAVADFLDWEVSSGRVADDGGSSWWRAVNGLMVLDLEEAGRVAGRASRDGTRGRSEAVAAWVDYARSGGEGDGQRLLWAAHQRSLHSALEAARGLLAGEDPVEQAFATVVVRVVDAAADRREPTDTATLAEMTRRLYPDHYPVTPEHLDGLRAALAAVATGAGGGRSPGGTNA